MKEIVLKLYEFDELSKDSQERIIERERWNIMDCCMEAYGADYISTMKSFGDLTNTEAYGWEVGYTRYDFRFKFKYNDPIYCHPTDYDKDIYPKVIIYQFTPCERYLYDNDILSTKEHNDILNRLTDFVKDYDVDIQLEEILKVKITI